MRSHHIHLCPLAIVLVTAAASEKFLRGSNHRSITNYEKDAGFAMNESDCRVPEGRIPKTYYQAEMTSLKETIGIIEENTEEGYLRKSEILIDAVTPLVKELNTCLKLLGTREDFGLAQGEEGNELDDQLMDLMKSLGEAGSNYLSKKYPDFEEEVQHVNFESVDDNSNEEDDAKLEGTKKDEELIEDFKVMQAKELVADALEVLAQPKENTQEKNKEDEFHKQEAIKVEEDMANLHAMVAIENLRMEQIQNSVTLNQKAHQDDILTNQECEENIKNYKSKVENAKDVISSVQKEISRGEEIVMVQVDGYIQKDDIKELSEEITDLKNEIMTAENTIKTLIVILDEKDNGDKVKANDNTEDKDTGEERVNESIMEFQEAEMDHVQEDYNDAMELSQQEENDMAQYVKDVDSKESSVKNNEELEIDEKEKVTKALSDLGLDQEEIENVLSKIESVKEDEAAELIEEEKEELNKDEDEFRQ